MEVERLLGLSLIFLFLFVLQTRLANHAALGDVVIVIQVGESHKAELPIGLPAPIGPQSG
jgi:hypothetical protein